MATPEARSPTPDELEVLRRLLLAPEQRAIEDLKSTDEQVRQLAENLPAGIQQRIQADKVLQNTLIPVMEEVLPILVRRNPKLLTEILYPVLLPAIRRLVERLFASLVQGFNQTLDQAFTPQGLRWRLEALSTGKSFGEVVLSHTLLYRVEQVLLIERISGLMLVHVVADGVKVNDGSMVSGMLTAIGDFVRDSFDPDAGLNTVNFGERMLVVEPGPRAVLAVVVSGKPPEEIKSRLQDTLSVVHVHFNRELSHYDGNNSTFEPAQPILGELLEARYLSSAQPKRPPYVLYLLGLLLVGLLGWWGYGAFQTNQAWRSYLSRLEQTPGLVVTAAPKIYVVRGLRDPHAPEPRSLLEGLKLKPERLDARFEPYQSLDPQMIVHRLRSLLNTPESVQLSWQGQTLVATGTAPRVWIDRLKEMAAAFGVEQLQLQVNVQ